MKNMLIVALVLVLIAISAISVGVSTVYSDPNGPRYTRVFTDIPSSPFATAVFTDIPNGSVLVNTAK